MGTSNAPGEHVRRVTSADSGATAVATFNSVSITGPSSGLPSGWTHGDIGTVGLSGSTSHTTGTFTVTGAGADIWGYADGLQFVSRELTGDGSIVARVATLQAGHEWAKAGVMMRESLAPGSRHGFALVTGSNGLAFQRRTSTDDYSHHTAGAAGTVPHWVRLTRVGSTLSAYTSTDGTAWTLVGTDTIPMANTISVGLAVTSHDVSATAVATFEQVSVTEGAWSGLPDGWATSDVGAVGVAGAGSYANGTFAVTGAGSDIWGTADQFRYIYRSLTGDGSITARVIAVDYVHHWTKAGVMIRESLAEGARHAYMLVSADRGLALQRRVTTDDISTHTDGGAGTAPRWVRLTRTGSTLTAYVSTDGTSWTYVGSDTITMGSSVYVGLAVTSHNNGATATATFDNVEAQ